MTEILKHELSNGLTLIGECSKWQKSCSVGFFVKTGARDETLKESGISHFLEHMVFKGTDKRDAIQLNFDMGNIGSQSNAYTSEENTVFYGTVIPEYFENLCEILSDMMRPKLDPTEFNMERKVILEEIALYDDKPNFSLFMKAFNDYFDSKPIGRPVLGTNESISAVSRDEMYEYYKRRYAASNMALVAAGNFDFKDLIKLAEKYVGDMPDWSTKREAGSYRAAPRKIEFRKKNLSQAYLLYITEGPHSKDELRIPMEVLSAIIGDSTGSKMFWDLVRPGLAETAVCEVDEREGTGCFIAFAAADVENKDTVSKKIMEILNSPMKFTEDDLYRVKKKLKSRLVLNGEIPSARMFAIGHGWTSRNRPQLLSEVLKELDGVTISDIRHALERYPLNNWCEYVMLPE